MKERANPTVALILVGNKCDIEKKIITTDQGLALANKEGLLFIEASAKTGDNITQIFDKLLSGIPNIDNIVHGIHISSKPSPSRKRCCH